MSNYFSIINGWMIPVTRAIELWNIQLQDVFEQCGLKADDFKDQESRVSAEKTGEIIEVCNKMAGRKDFAIAIAKQFHPGMFHALGYAMLSSNTLKDAFSRIARYKRVVSNTCILEVEDLNDEVCFKMEVLHYEDSLRQVLSHDSIIAFLGTIVQFARETLKTNYSPRTLHLNWPKPNFDTSFINDYFNCEVLFDCDDICLIYDQETLTKPLVGGNPLLTQTHEKMLDEYLLRIDKDDVVQSVKNRIYDLLPLGTPSQTDIASHLGMSLRNLQRRLHDRDTSFREILEKARKKLALEYIHQNHLSFSEIGYLVGFSNIGNFNRAFKRWTGSTPGVYRRDNHTFSVLPVEKVNTTI